MPGTAQISPCVLTHWLLTVPWRRFYQYHIVTGRERGWELAQGLTFGIYWDLNTDQLSLGPVLTITNDFQLMARKGTVPVVGFKFTSVGLEESPLRSSPADCWMQMAGVWRHCGPWSLTSEQKPPSPMTLMCHGGNKISASQGSSDHNLPVAMVEMWPLTSISGECETALEPQLFFILVTEFLN